MKLVIGGKSRQFVDVRTFRSRHHLPDSFGTAYFEPKDYSGLGQIDGAGTDLRRLRTAVIKAIPTRIAPDELIECMARLESIFREALYAINGAVGLREVEVEFAVAGFDNVNHALVYAIMRARAAGEPPPKFAPVYDRWLNNTMRISTTVYSYPHGGETWQVQVVNHAYGRAGLIVTMPGGTAYVHDSTLACPAEQFMRTLLRDVARRVIAAMALWEKNRSE